MFLDLSPTESARNDCPCPCTAADRCADKPAQDDPGSDCPQADLMRPLRPLLKGGVGAARGCVLTEWLYGSFIGKHQVL
jgi:hypothetical protein